MQSVYNRRIQTMCVTIKLTLRGRSACVGHIGGMRGELVGGMKGRVWRGKRVIVLEGKGRGGGEIGVE